MNMRDDLPQDATIFEFHAAPEQAGERLDRYLSAQPELQDAAISRTRIKKLIEDGCVFVQDAPVFDPAAKIEEGARIRLAAPPPAPAEPAGEAIPLNILFEDDALIVVNKPAGLVTHPAPGHLSGTLVNALIAHCGDSLSGIGGVMRPGVVHRLDKDTSGVMIAAKSDAAHQRLSAYFADHGRSVHFVREYEAIAWSAPPRAQGRIDAPLARHRQNREKIVVAARGREAITHWRVMERFFPADCGADLAAAVASRVTCRLETGRTHQIRAHLSHIGCPLIGDPLYGSGFRTKAAQLPSQIQELARAFPRQALHAARLELPHPISGEILTFSAEPPEDMRNLLTALREMRKGA